MPQLEPVSAVRRPARGASEAEAERAGRIGISDVRRKPDLGRGLSFKN
jgi:hypothetical protein